MENISYQISYGTVQAFACCFDHDWWVPFGIPQYDSRKPILTASNKEKAQAILDRLNSGEISEKEAERLLYRIY